jgi:ADP-heptose:LPS heptosyltransferase
LDFKRILVFRVGHLGDTLVALPAFWAIRRAFPDAEMTLLSNNDLRNRHYISAQTVLPKEGLFDDWLTYPTNLAKPAALAANIRLILNIRRRRYDVVFYLMTRNRTVKQIRRDVRFFKLSGIEEIVGAGYLRRNLLEAPIPRPTPAVEPESTFLLDCLSSARIGIDVRSLHPDLRLTSAETRAVERWAADKIDTRSDTRLIAVAPGSKWESKVWSEDRFAQVVSELIRSHKVFPIVFGGSEDRPKGNRLLEIWGTGANACGELSVREAAALLERCELYLGNDTGTMHLAAAVGTRCVAIFAAIDWIGRWQPYGHGHCLFRERVECEGCHSPICFNNRKCLDLVTAQRVKIACETVLESREFERSS